MATDMINKEPKTLKEMAAQVEELRLRFLFSPEFIQSLDCFAGQEFLSALAFLELARGALARGQLHQATRASASMTREEMVAAVTAELIERGHANPAGVWEHVNGCWPTDDTVDELADGWEELAVTDHLDY